VTCEEARPLVHAYVDGELDVVRSLEVEAHIRSCGVCAREQASLRALHTAFSNGAYTMRRRLASNGVYVRRCVVRAEPKVDAVSRFGTMVGAGQLRLRSFSLQL
jgi:anti-sigma factor RsiW